MRRASVTSVVPSDSVSATSEAGREHQEGSAAWLLDEKELYKLALLLQEKLDVKTRTWRLRSYRKCFVGREAVSYLVDNNLAGSRAEAVSIGNSLLQRGWLHHVVHQHPFADEYLFYRLNLLQSREDEGCTSDDSSSVSGVVESSVVRSGKSSSSPFNALRKENTGEEWTVGKQLTAVQSKVHRLSVDMDVLRRSMACTMELQQKLTETQDRLDEAISAIHRSEGAVFVLLGVVAYLLLLHLLPLKIYGLDRLLCVVVGSGVIGIAWQLWKVGDAPHHARLFVSHVRHKREGVVHSYDTAATGSAQEGELMVEFEEQQVTADVVEVPEDVADYPIPRLDDFAASPDRPVLVRLNPRITYQKALGDADANMLPVNTGSPIRVESNNFIGGVLLYLRHLSSTPPGVFDGLKRNSLTIVQGTFKQAVPFKHLVTGEEFRRGLKNLPPKWLVQDVLVKVATRITPSVRIQLNSHPHILSHVLTIAQVVNVQHPGDEPDITKIDYKNIKDVEDMRLADPRLVDENGKPFTASRRKRFYASPSNMEGLMFQPGLVYTFVFYEQYINFSTYNLDIVYGFDLSRYFDGQPLISMMKDERAGEYCFLLELWHEKLIADAHAHAAQSIVNSPKN